MGGTMAPREGDRLIRGSCIPDRTLVEGSCQVGILGQHGHYKEWNPIQYTVSN